MKRQHAKTLKTFIPTTEQPKTKSIIRDPKYSGGYVIGGPLFVLGTVAEFASTRPQEILYVSDDGSIQGLSAPDPSSSTFNLTHHDSVLGWNIDDPVIRARGLGDYSDGHPDVSFVTNYEQPTLFMETNSNQFVIGIEANTLSFWNQLTMLEDEMNYNLINSTFLEIKQSGLYQMNIYLITREQTSTIGKRCLILNVSYEVLNENKQSEDEEDFITFETQLILNEQQPSSDIDSDCIHYVLRLVNLKENDIISLKYQIVDGVDEDQTCILPNSVWSIKLIELEQNDEEESESCSLSSLSSQDDFAEMNGLESMNSSDTLMS